MKLYKVEQSVVSQLIFKYIHNYNLFIYIAGDPGAPKKPPTPTPASTPTPSGKCMYNFEI